METQGLVRLLRLELECNHYAVNTVREYTRLVSLLLLVPLIRLYISTPRRQRHPPPPLRGGVTDSRDEDTRSCHGTGSGRIGLWGQHGNSSAHLHHHGCTNHHDRCTSNHHDCCTDDYCGTRYNDGRTCYDYCCTDDYTSGRRL